MLNFSEQMDDERRGGGRAYRAIDLYWRSTRAWSELKPQKVSQPVLVIDHLRNPYGELTTSPPAACASERAPCAFLASQPRSWGCGLKWILGNCNPKPDRPVYFQQSRSRPQTFVDTGGCKTLRQLRPGFTGIRRAG